MMARMKFIIALVFPTAIYASASITLSNSASVGQAIGQMTKAMISYYNQNNYLGAFGPQDGGHTATSIQWYESGVAWDAILGYASITKDNQFVGIAANALWQASYQDATSFLGDAGMQKLSETLGGKWNDDLAWYALATMTGAELLGPNTKLYTGASTYSAVTVTTFNQIWSQWDPSCSGGIWWSRDRNSAGTKDYKSVITNAQMIMLSARLYGMTNNATYLQAAQQIYGWLKSSGIVTSGWHIYDGINYSPSGCVLNAAEYSYSYGILMGGLVLLSKYSNNPIYASDAAKILDVALSVFTVNNVITDICEQNNNCAVNSISPKGSFIRGLTYYYNNTNDATIKTKIQTAIDASVVSMAQNSCDSNWGCYNTWQGPNAKVQTDFHSELNSLQLMNAAVMIHSASNIPGATSNITPPPTASKQNSALSLYTGFYGTSLSGCFFAFAIFSTFF